LFSIAASMPTMWCPNCGAEYRRGFTVCPDCNRALVDDLPDSSKRAPGGPPSEAVMIHRAPNSQIAELIRGLLESEGIPCSLGFGGIMGAYPVNVGSLAEVTITVRVQDADRARALIESAERGEFSQ